MRNHCKASNPQAAALLRRQTPLRYAVDQHAERCRSLHRPPCGNIGNFSPSFCLIVICGEIGSLINGHVGCGMNADARSYPPTRIVRMPGTTRAWLSGPDPDQFAWRSCQDAETTARRLPRFPWARSSADNAVHVAQNGMDRSDLPQASMISVAPISPAWWSDRACRVDLRPADPCIKYADGFHIELR